MSGEAPVPSADDLLKPSAAAAYLNMSEATLAKWRGSGGGPEFKKFGPTGRIVRYRRGDLDRYRDGGGR